MRFFRIEGVMAGLGLVCAATMAQAALTGTPSFRVRADLAADLNVDLGWAAGLNERATVFADQPFRVRLELERGAATPGTTGIILQYRRNDEEDWVEVLAHDFPYPEAEEPRSPRVSVVRTPGYSHGEPTTDVLRGSIRPFAGGTGINLAGQAPAWTTVSGHLEIEWPVVVRRWVDDAVTNEEGDRFELRLADGRGNPLPGQTVAKVTLAIHPGHVGGTFVETPGRIGPWQAANGDLYFVMEPAESSNLFMMIKSTDGGRTWREVDGANRPRTNDLESVDGHRVSDTIHLVHQVTRSVRHHTFRTSDHPTQPDTWAVRDELAASVRSIAQAVSLVVRSDLSLVSFFVGSTVHYAIRSPAGEWSADRPLDPSETQILAGPQAVLGADDTVHLAYYRADGTLWYRRLLPNGSVTAAVRLADGAGMSRANYGSVLPLVYLPASDTAVVLYRLAEGRLWERRIARGSAPTPAVAVTDRTVVQNAVDSQQAGADVVADGENLHVLFIDETTRDIYSTDDRGGWQPSVRRVGEVDAAWVRGGLLRRQNVKRTYGYIFDAGSGGGAGMNRFGEFEVGNE